jgi:hypothetical protein
MRDHDASDAEDDPAELIESANKLRRPYAGHSSTRPRDREERQVVRDFSESARTEPGLPFSDVRSRRRGDDPLDCEADGSNGALIAVAVTELVDNAAIKAKQAAAKAGDLLQRPGQNGAGPGFSL